MTEHTYHPVHAFFGERFCGRRDMSSMGCTDPNSWRRGHRRWGEHCRYVAKRTDGGRAGGALPQHGRLKTNVVGAGARMNEGTSWQLHPSRSSRRLGWAGPRSAGARARPTRAVLHLILGSRPPHVRRGGGKELCKHAPLGVHGRGQDGGALQPEGYARGTRTEGAP